MNKNELLREIPQVEKLLQDSRIASFISEIGHSAVAKTVKKEIENYRQKINSGGMPDIDSLLFSVCEECRIKKMEKIQRVINCSGIIIHTNLGRAPLGSEIFLKASQELPGYCNLEFSISTEKRGARGGFAEELLCSLTGAEDALIVNNNASSVFLILSHFAKGREVIVSRGELIQIGGGFRIPDIMKETGAVLVETGTTNITTLDDYSNSISADTSMIFSAHRSNYRIDGFASLPSLREIASLKRDGIIFVRDLGSGNLLDPQKSAALPEPSVRSELSQGPDLVCFSGDKLLGACQAGIIIGKKELVSALRRSPLMRMIRVDKLSYFILQETLLKYDSGEYQSVKLHSLLSRAPERALKSVNRILRRLSPAVRPFIHKTLLKSAYGGGALPSVEFDCAGLVIKPDGFRPARLYTEFLNSPVPVIGVLLDDSFVLNFAAVEEGDLAYLAGLINKVCGV